MGVMAPHFVSDHGSDPLRVRQNVVVPKAQDAEALAPQEVCSADLLFRLPVMPTAIDLDDQPGLVTDKIGDIASDWNLATKPATIQLASTEHSPQRALTVRHLAPERLCPSNCAVHRMSLSALKGGGTVTRVVGLNCYLCTRSRPRHDHPHPTLPHQGGGLQVVEAMNVDRP